MATKRRKRRKKLKAKDIIKLCLIAFIAVIIIVAGVFVGIIISTAGSDVLDIDDISLDFTSVVYCVDDEGNEIEYESLYQDENRVWVDFAEIPAHVKNAAVAIEDERFYKHIGFDIKSTAYATFNYLVKGSSDRGASTITQQLVKNLTGEKDKSPVRKVKEIVLAIRLEQKMTKEQILELYLNTIYLGHRCNGIGSAAEYYFDKDVSELTVAESAAIIGITQYPSLYDPIANPDKNKEKQELILYKMNQLGFLPDEEYTEAKEQELVFVAKEQTHGSVQSYFVDALIEEVLEDLQNECGYTETVAKKMLYTGGLKIYCTVDPQIQEIMDKVYMDPASFAKAPRDVQPQSSMTIIDPYTGYVKGLVGGRGEKTADRVLNRATQTQRQPGSSIKPIAVYGPAIDLGISSPGTIWTDKPVTFGSWTPKNYGGDFKGPVTMRYAVQQSLNTIAVQVLDNVGTTNSYNYMTQKLGAKSLVETDKNLAALALGGLTNGITNIEMTAAYAAFVNDGVYIEPVTYTKIVNSSGKVIYEKEQQKNIAFSKDTSRIMLNVLKSAVSGGTGSSAYFAGGYDIGGKTGTTDDDKDRWFVGVTPYYAGAVWVGFDEPAPLNFFPSNPATRAWKLVMSEVHKVKGLPSKYFPGVTSKYTSATVCADSGLLPGPDCEHDLKGTRLRSDYFLPREIPSKECDFEHELEESAEEETTEDEHTEGSSSDETNTSDGSGEEVTPPANEPPVNTTIDPGLLSENGL